MQGREQWEAQAQVSWPIRYRPLRGNLVGVFWADLAQMDPHKIRELDHILKSGRTVGELRDRLKESAGEADG